MTSISTTSPRALPPDALASDALTSDGLGSGTMFDAIARRYDLLNRILSLGIDRRWRRRAVAALKLQPGAQVLDLATGTADVALEILRQHPDAEVIGLDPSTQMLDVGRTKAREKAVESRLELREGDAQQLPFEADAFDGITIAFGIRNVPDRSRALREMTRVVRPGGRVANLELNQPRGGLIAPFARFHIHTVVPRLGAWLSGAREYRYLERSIAAFPQPEEFADLMREAGLDVLRIDRLAFGSCCLFVATPAATSSPTSSQGEQEVNA